ncbi:hypothetical protein ACQ4LE_004965 [Meloidogyne hapla]|uniref:Uncharacterized protein n=1 Tax=Meloidogyne hapla TaxID=6305 RepID=A0A1I8B5P2_MELHA
MRFSIAFLVLTFILVISTMFVVESRDEGGNQEEIEQQYQNRKLRSLANGRWQLRPGKRFVPESYYYQMMLDN